MAKVCIQAYVSGKVQGVWYRQSAKQRAMALNVTGWANNLADGRVETFLCGEEIDVQAVVEWLAQGPEQARVDGVESKLLEYREISSFSTG